MPTGKESMSDSGSGVQSARYRCRSKTFQIGISDNVQRDVLLEDTFHDCALAFNCRAIETDEDNYSTGSTYFIRPCETARCGLEELALDIFKFHTQGKAFNPSLSGAEWWTQVIDPADDIGVHWDRDYGIEEETGMHIYPNIATVTYFSDNGGPTLIFDKEGTPDSSLDFTGKVHAVELCKPRMLKHLAFPGNLLHAAPSSIIYEDEDEDEDEDDNEEEEEATVGGGDSDKSSKLFHTRKPSGSALAEELVYANGAHHDSEDNLDSLLNCLEQKRITFLVNVWINHIPSQSIRCVEDLFSKFKMPVRIGTAPQFFLTPPPPLSVTDILTKRIHMLTTKDIQRKVQLNFVNNDIRYKVVVPLPSREKCLEYLERDEELVAFLFDDRKIVAKAGVVGKGGWVGAVTGTGSSSSSNALAPVSSGNVSGGMCIEVDYSSDQDSSEEDSSEEEEDDDDEEEEEEQVGLPLSSVPSKASSSMALKAIPVGRNVSNTSLEAGRRKKTKLT